MGLKSILCGMAVRACAILGLLALFSAQPAAAARRLAVVFGYGAYVALPALPICPQSATAVAEALRKIGFEVTEIRNASNGTSSAALSAFVHAVAESPAFVAVYACGYVTGLDGRPFMLPVSAEITRPSDVLTQGMLAKSFLDLPRGGTYPAIVVLDGVPLPGSGAIGLGALVHSVPLRTSLFAAAAVANDTTTPTTALAAALVKAVGTPEVDAAGVLDSLGHQLDATASLATAGSAPEKARLSTPPPASPAPATPTSAVPATVPAALDAGERRRVQAALKQLGLYAGPLNGVFGATTAAAVRRFQTVRGSEPTGQLDEAQMQQLLALVGKPP